MAGNVMCFLIGGIAPLALTVWLLVQH